MLPINTFKAWMVTATINQMRESQSVENTILVIFIVKRMRG